MELESEDGSVIPIESGSDTVIGRQLGFYAADRTVSRRHLICNLLGHQDAKFRASFEVIGKNPIWVCSKKGGDKRIYHGSEKGVLEVEDCLSLSLKNPIFLVLKSREAGPAPVDKSVLDAVERRERRTLERRKEKESERTDVSGGEGDMQSAVEGLEIELGSMDVSHIDPVKEFGFLVKGHEFDCYPRTKVRAIKDWNWYLNEPKRKKTEGDDTEDDDWNGESEDEIDLVAEVGSAKRAKCMTRSEDPHKLRDGTSRGGKSTQQKNAKVHEFDEDDETLGGFIVDEGEEDELGEGEEEEEEELSDKDESDDE